MNTTDKSKELNTSIVLVNQKLNFTGKTDGSETLSIDYTAPLGDGLGFTSLELLLLSLSSCVGSTVLVFLRRKERTITGFGINAKGIRREEHPTCFSKIFLEINLQSPDIKEADLDKVIKLSEQTYCPVWAMLMGNVEVEVLYNITGV
ncbi:MAG: OsmC family protein [Bacteroidales bacterium]|nr:OsmC family protein [Bacteroidales bacterium]